MKSVLSRLAKPVALATVAVVISSLLSGLVSFDSLVYVDDGQNKRIVLTKLENPREILEEADVTLGKYDAITYGEIRNQVYSLKIDRAYPVSIKADGRQYWAPMRGETVALALERAGITLGEEDTVAPALTENVTEDTKIVVTRISYRTREEVSEIPYDTITERTPTLKDGVTKVVTPGVPGQKTTVYEEYVVDGEVQDSKLVEERVDKNPVTEVVLLGDKTVPVSPLAAPASLTLDANGNPTSYVKKLTGKGTAYSAGDGAKTASGRNAVVGHVAVNPNVIPYGTKLYIKASDGSFTYGYAIAADTGTALMDGRVLVDLFFDTNQECYAFGAKTVDVYVLE